MHNRVDPREQCVNVDGEQRQKINLAGNHLGIFVKLERAGAILIASANRVRHDKFDLSVGHHTLMFGQHRLQQASQLWLTQRFTE
jgi:hypothetical protein